MLPTVRSRLQSLALKRVGSRALSTYGKGKAKHIMESSCYYNTNYVISEDATVYEAIKRMAGLNSGCLAVSGEDGKFAGLITERDYLKKVELQGLQAKDTKVSQIMTQRARVIVAHECDTPQHMMAKMLSSDIRHLPVVDDQGNMVGLLSIKDIVREVSKSYEKNVNTLTNFALGKGGHFVLD